MDDCRNLARVGNRKCRTCESRAWRARHPVTNLFNNLRNHARARGIEFTLTTAEFRQFAELTGYVDRHGREREGLHVDRIEARHGYHAWNIQALTNGENARKQWADLRSALGPRHTRAGILAAIHAGEHRGDQWKEAA